MANSNLHNLIESDIEKFKIPKKKLGIMAKGLNGEILYSLNPHKRFFTASCSKVVTAISLYYKLEKDNISDNTFLEYSEVEKVGGSGILQYMTPFKDTIYNFLVRMLTISDNTSSDIIINFITKALQSKVIKMLGLSKTFLRQTNREVVNGEFNLPAYATYKDWEQANKRCNNAGKKYSNSLSIKKGNVSTPSELCKVLESLLNPKIISERNAKLILNLMKHNLRFNLFYNPGPMIEIAHKTGAIPTVLNEMGIIFSQKPYYLVFLSKDLNSNEKSVLLENGKNISKHVFDYSSGQNA
jgi:beta-lactamase class A